jgi:acetyl esterase/lipase
VNTFRHARPIGVLCGAVLLLASCTDSRSSSPAATTTSASTTSASPTSASTVPPAACVGSTPVARVTVPYRVIEGVDPDLLSLDVYGLASDGPCPVAVWVHGGGWRQGDKRGGAIERKAEYFADLGIVLVSVNYRLAAPENQVRWPDFGEDVAAATAFVLDRATELGIDPERLVLIGHSAGAHLVSIVATHPRLMADAGRSTADVRCFVSLDSAGYDLRDGIAPGGEGIVAVAFGDDPEVLADASPMVQVAGSAGRVGDALLVTRGGAERVAETSEFASALRTAGAAATVLDAQGYSHADVNRRLGEPGESVVTPAVTEFIGSCIGPADASS